MLPPVDPTVLSNNPRFNAVYQDLSTNKLNSDGTSKILDGKVLREREAFAEELRKARVEVAGRELVVSGLRELEYRGTELPEDNNITPIAPALSSHLAQDVAAIAKILDPDNPPKSQDLIPTILELKASLSTSESHLHNSRLQLATEATKAHALTRQAIQQSIAILEQTLHGSMARASKTKAEYLAVVAEGMSKKLALQSHQLNGQLYSAEVQAALKAKAEEVAAEARTVRRKVREAEERLEGYRAVGGIEGVAKEYAEVVAERERVQGEIERLEGGGP